jgi:protein Tex
LSNAPEFNPASIIAEELGVPAASVAAVLALLKEGATVPFIARYRKEATGGLDEVQIRTIDERRTYLTELHARRESIAAEIESQGKLTPELRKKLFACQTKAELEDLYLPYKPKRRTRAMIARERGLEPLAELMWAQGATGNAAAEAARFVDAARDVPDVAAALAGARDICAERISENADVRKLVREALASHGTLRVGKTKEHADAVTKFDNYASFEEPLARIPSHRYLAIRRGEAEGVLHARFHVDPEPVLARVRRLAGVNERSPWAPELVKSMEDAYKRLVLPSAEVEQQIELKMRADRAAVDVFAQNLRELLLAAPFGTKVVLGIDPGQRTGCKCAVSDATGKLLAHEVLYLVQGKDALERAKAQLRALCKKHGVSAVAVGNGTHGRETEQFVREVLAAEGLKEVPCVPVSEAGASVYSASDVAREEFPDLDLTVRGAISIARRLQDPLAELVKVDPKSIGVGQYQHDVYQPLLAKKLDEVVESCVNRVGVELNTASAPLLARVAGIGPSLATKIVQHRNAHGRFASRTALLKVSGIGPRTFEQAAGFLRISGGEHPLDASAVHPERYGIVERMAKDLGVPLASLVGNTNALAQVKKERYFGEGVGEFTMNDILAELAKPGRDPRASFEPPKFRDDVRTMEDLRPGMELEGVVTNVTAFGAFVDVGVHQDGLVHVSKLSDRFVQDPSTVVKVGDKLQVRVVEVDLARKRISLSARKDEGPRPPGGAPQQKGPAPQQKRPAPGGKSDARSAAASQAGFANNPFAKLLKK